MNYRHLYHAGHAADVVKHSVLLLLLQALKMKEKGFCYIDTHAAIGMYDLASEQANKTTEYKHGINLLTGNYNHPILQDYLNLIKTTGINYYPGSPWLAAKTIRPQDKIILNELHPEDHQTLKKLFKSNRQVAIHNRDAYECLPALLPPALRRGLVLIDPPFEQVDEKEKLRLLLEKCYKKWPQGVYMIWLPLKNESLHKFYKNIAAIGFKDECTFHFTWKATTDKTNALIGCSIIILNLPFNAKPNLIALLNELKTALRAIDAGFVML